MYFGEPVRRFPWTWSILRPAYRFVGCGHTIGTDDDIVRFCLGLAYEQEVRSELVDPEWPSITWEQIIDN